MKERHELSAMFPDIVGSEWEAFVGSIRRNGLRDPITLYEDKVLDGWQRYRACHEAGVKARFVRLKPGIDPVDFVISQNVKRQHYTYDQRALIALRLAELLEEDPSLIPHDQ